MFDENMEYDMWRDEELEKEYVLKGKQMLTDEEVEFLNGYDPEWVRDNVQKALFGDKWLNTYAVTQAQIEADQEKKFKEGIF